MAENPRGQRPHHIPAIPPAMPPRLRFSIANGHWTPSPAAEGIQPPSAPDHVDVTSSTTISLRGENEESRHDTFPDEQFGTTALTRNEASLSSKPGTKSDAALREHESRVSDFETNNVSQLFSEHSLADQQRVLVSYPPPVDEFPLIEPSTFDQHRESEPLGGDHDLADPFSWDLEYTGDPLIFQSRMGEVEGEREDKDGDQKEEEKYGTSAREGYFKGLRVGYHSGHGDGYHSGHEDGYDEGHEDGYDEGYEDGDDEGHEDGYGKGYEDGYDDAPVDRFEEAYDRGFEDGRRELIDDGRAVDYAERSDEEEHGTLIPSEDEVEVEGSLPLPKPPSCRKRQFHRKEPSDGGESEYGEEEDEHDDKRSRLMVEAEHPTFVNALRTHGEKAMRRCMHERMSRVDSSPRSGEDDKEQSTGDNYYGNMYHDHHSAKRCPSAPASGPTDNNAATGDDDRSSTVDAEEAQSETLQDPASAGTTSSAPPPSRPTVFVAIPPAISTRFSTDEISYISGLDEKNRKAVVEALLLIGQEPSATGLSSATALGLVPTTAQQQPLSGLTDHDPPTSHHSSPYKTSSSGPARPFGPYTVPPVAATNPSWSTAGQNYQNYYGPSTYCSGRRSGIPAYAAFSRQPTDPSAPNHPHAPAALTGGTTPASHGSSGVGRNGTEVNRGAQELERLSQRMAYLSSEVDRIEQENQQARDRLLPTPTNNQTRSGRGNEAYGSNVDDGREMSQDALAQESATRTTLTKHCHTFPHGARQDAR